MNRQEVTDLPAVNSLYMREKRIPRWCQFLRNEIDEIGHFVEILIVNERRRVDVGAPNPIVNERRK